MTRDFASTYRSLLDHFRRTATLEGINELLGWDERTMLPPRGGAHRAEQMSLLAGVIHEERTAAWIGDALTELMESGWIGEEDPDHDVSATLTVLHRDYERLTKIPGSLVTQLTRATVRGQQIWVEARRSDDFSQFAPILNQIIGLSREKADAIGYENCPYDALLDEYEPGARTGEVANVLADLGRELGPLVQEISASGRTSPRPALEKRYPIAAQRQFGLDAASRIGFDFSAGRMDETHHPFCTTLGPHDCRITTRYDEQFFPSAFFGTLHEAGHGIYEQGLRAEFYGLPPGQPASLGIHESQSRLWENFVGRSYPFWKFFYPAACRAFPQALSDVTLDQFYWAVNDVRPSLIRVEADEATYNLHIIIRFELEQRLINDRMPVEELPEAWNQLYGHYLGIQSPSDADGVLQDIHWSAGLFGYFATYSLGNLYAAQLIAQAKREMPDLSADFARGDFCGLLSWLRCHVHHHGRCRPAAELVRQISGESISSSALMAYLREKLTPLYGLA